MLGPGVHRPVPDQRGDQRRLAPAVRPDDAHPLAEPDRQIDGPQRETATPHHGAMQIRDPVPGPARDRDLQP